MELQDLHYHPLLAGFHLYSGSTQCYKRSAGFTLKAPSLLPNLGKVRGWFLNFPCRENFFKTPKVRGGLLK